MLDDLGMIHQRDRDDALGLVEKQWQQLTQTLAVRPALKTDQVDNVVFAGMGGSALAAQYAKSWPLISKPFEVVRDYQLPSYVDQDTLCIISSYSGNTEETLSCLAQAEAKKAQIVIITDGGQLAEIAEAKHYPAVLIPQSKQPRYAVWSSFVALQTILAQAGLVGGEEVQTKLAAAAKFMEMSVAAWLPTVPTADNLAKKIARELLGKSVVIYSSTALYPAAYHWKIGFNENAKNIAWCNAFPEFHHNEFIGWSGQPQQKPYGVVMLESGLDQPHIQARFKLTERLLSGRWPAPQHVTAEGDDWLQQLLWLGTLGEFVSLYLGLLNNVDLANVDLVEKFKQELAKS